MPTEPTRPIMPRGFAPAGGAPPDRGEPIDITWSGSPWSLTGVSFLNFFLTIITLGIYGFWGRTEIRRRIWSSIRLQGEPLVYTGTGKELFLGFMFALLVVFLPAFVLLTAVAIAAGPQSVAYALTTAVVYVGFFCLVGAAVYRARRYRLTRTAWRGIRGGMTGSAASFAWLWVWTSVLIPFTLGWILPWRANKIQQRLTSETSFGDRQFTYDGRSRPLYGAFALLWFGAIVLYVAAIAAIVVLFGKDALAAAERKIPYQPSPTQVAMMVAIGFGALTLLSLIGAWYRARMLNLFASFTGIDGARLSMRVTAGGLIGLILTNLFITLLSLGILAPVAQARAVKYLVDRLAIEGPVDLQSILQSKSALGRGGEGLAQVLDVDAF